MAATVRHGRRRGTSRDSPTQELPPLQGTLPFSAPVTLQNGAQPDINAFRQMTIMSKGDWDRIQIQLNKRGIEEDRVARNRQEKDRLRELSKQQIKNWTNTIAGQRQKKLEARDLREAKEEEERKLIDIEEAKFQAQKRKEAIERAKTQQYYQTDRVKGFHGALLLTEVLKEREAQLELTRLKEGAVARQDKEWLEIARRDYEEGILRDQAQAGKSIKLTRDHADFQKLQINEHRKIVVNEIREDEAEGEELKRLSAQYELEKKRLDEIRKKEEKSLMVDNVQQIEDVHRMRQIQQQQEEEEDEECRIFAAAKRKMMKLRAEKEKQLHTEKQQRLEGIRQKLHAQMVQKLDDEDDRIIRATKESEAKLAVEESKKEAHNRKGQAAMVAHREKQMKEQERIARDERKKELEMLCVRREADAQFQRLEEEKVLHRLDEKKALQKFHIKQRDEAEVVQKISLEEQLAQDKKNEELLGLEEVQFQEYAQKVIGHCANGGRNVYPLQKAAQEGAGGGRGPVFDGKGGVRPSYMVADQSGVQMPNYQRGTTDETKQRIYGNGHTNKRMGFVW